MKSNHIQLKAHALLNALALLAVASFSSVAYAETFSSAILIPNTLGTGLNGSFYSFNTWPGSLANAQDLINAAGAPAATFIAQSVCFPSCNNAIGDDSMLAQLLGSNATHISANNVSSLSFSAMVLNGYIAINTPGNYQFTLLSDDGSRLQIGGTTIINADGDHGLSGGSAIVGFTNPGLYKIGVLAFEDQGATGLTVLQNGNALTASQLFTSAVPEADQWVMMLCGLPLVGWVARRRQTTKQMLLEMA